MSNGAAQTSAGKPDTDTAQIVVDLLRASLGKLDTDPAIATRLIARACSVLRTSQNPYAEAGTPGGLLAWQMAKITSHVDRNLDRPITIRELAATVRLGPSYFQRAFKRSFGISPHAFLLQRRIRRAQTLMLTTDNPLCEIALSAGFSDQSHLTTRFHRAIGTTPSAWRRNCRLYDDATQTTQDFGSDHPDFNQTLLRAGLALRSGEPGAAVV